MNLFKIIKNYTNDEDFNKELKHLGLNFFDNEETGLTLIKYNHADKSKYDFDNHLVRFARGLIFDRKTRKVVCIPPEKSLHIVPFSQNITPEQWLNVDIELFVDGTMINCFHHNYAWHISTRSFIGANCKWYSQKHFNQLFDEAKGNLEFDKLNKEYCYSFVLMHPENRIVTEYSTADICMVHVREIRNEMYIEHNLEVIQKQLNDIGIEVNIPNKYTITKPDDINDIMKAMDYQKQGLVFKFNGMRSKVRNMEYDKAKHLRGNNKNIFFNYIELRQNSMIKEYLQYFPEYKDEFNNYRKMIEIITMKLHSFYKECYIYKKKDKNEIPFELRPICYEMHGIYLESKQKWNRDNVIGYFNKMAPARMIFIINFEKNKEYHMEKTKESANKKEVSDIVEDMIADIVNNVSIDVSISEPIDVSMNEPVLME